MSIASCTSPFASASTFPISRVTVRARVSLSRTSRSATWNRISPRRGAGIRRHDPKAATGAFGGGGRVPAPRRGEILFHVAERLVRDKETLARTVTREMGKVLAEAKGDVQEAIDMAYYMAAEGRRQFGLVVPSELPDKSALCVREPVGVV